jgi:hypothetical protein
VLSLQVVGDGAYYKKRTLEYMKQNKNSEEAKALSSGSKVEEG